MFSQKMILTASILAAGVIAAPASASYMSNCNDLISKWDVCKESSEDCTAETKALETQCKCHVQKGNEWKLVKAAVSKDGVCGKPPITIEIPPPPPPPPVIIDNPPKGGAGGHGDAGEQRGDNGGRGKD